MLLLNDDSRHGEIRPEVVFLEGWQRFEKYSTSSRLAQDQEITIPCFVEVESLDTPDLQILEEFTYFSQACTLALMSERAVGREKTEDAMIDRVEREDQVATHLWENEGGEKQRQMNQGPHSQSNAADKGAAQGIRNGPE